MVAGVSDVRQERSVTRKRIRAWLLAATLTLTLCACAVSVKPQPPPPGTEAEIAEVERIGRAVWVHDAAASRATDELVKVGAFATDAPLLLGWITVAEPDGLVVRFIGKSGGAYSAFYDVSFPRSGAAVVNRLSVPNPLPPAQIGAFRARQTAIDGATLDCSDRYNTVVLPNPIGVDGGWLVYLLPATTVQGRVMVGRQLRFLVSADGERIVESGALSKDCMYIDRNSIPAGAEVRVLFLSNLVTPTPNESHVFLSLQENVPFSVKTSLGIWMVLEGEISYVGPHESK